MGKWEHIEDRPVRMATHKENNPNVDGIEWFWKLNLDIHSSKVRKHICYGAENRMSRDSYTVDPSGQYFLSCHEGQKDEAL